MHVYPDIQPEFSSTIAPPDLFPRVPDSDRKIESPPNITPDAPIVFQPIHTVLDEPRSIEIDPVTDFSTANELPDGNTLVALDVGGTGSNIEIEQNVADYEMTEVPRSILQVSSGYSARSLDLAERIGGYRLLELISEQASSGLVNKIVISQEHLGRFINSVSPGAYASLTKVDFATLDQFLISPVGVYGSKSEIVRLLIDIKAVDEDTAIILKQSNSQSSVHTKPHLPSGLYIFEAPLEVEAAKKFYVVYWPEETTWDDNATSAVAKNRVTFMRYLTKITDQVLALISPEHAKALVFGNTVAAEEPEKDEEDEENEERMFSFKVSKTNEQTEGVTMHPGFELSHRNIHTVEPPKQSPLDEHILQPVLVPSETQQAFMTAMYNPEKLLSKSSPPIQTEVALRTLLRDKHQNLYLSEQMSDDALEILVKLGLDDRFPPAVTAWKRRNNMADQTAQKHLKEKLEETKSKLEPDGDRLKVALERVALQHVLKLYRPFFNDIELSSSAMSKLGPSEMPACTEYLENLRILFPKVQDVQAQELQKLKLHDLSSQKKYTRLKKRFLTVTQVLDGLDPEDLERNEVQSLTDAILGTGELEHSLPARLSDGKSDNDNTGILARIRGQFSKTVSGIFTPNDGPSQIISTARQAASLRDTSDLVFLQTLPRLCEDQPLLLESTCRIGDVIRGELKRRISVFVDNVFRRIKGIQIEHLDAEIRREADVIKKNEKIASRLALIHDIHATYGSALRLGCTLESVKEVRGSPWSSSKSYEVSIRKEFKSPAHISYTMHVLALTSDDKHKLLESGYNYVPRPSVASHPPTFSVPIGERIRHIQMFENKRCLLILQNMSGDITVFLEDIYGLGHAVETGKNKAAFSHTKLGSDVVFAVDETRGLLALVTSDGSNVCRLHVYRIMIADASSPVGARGTPITLHSWHEGALHITRACFVAGTEELLLVDNLTARIYSLVTQQYRPAPLQFISKPSAVFSSPDGACLLAIEQENELSLLRVYHWESFGSKDGIVLELPDVNLTSFAVTSLTQRNIVHVLFLSPPLHACRSVSLCITRRSSEFKFRAQNEHFNTNPQNLHHTLHNCLLDCHSTIWTRFPVVPAIRRSTIRPEGRIPGWLQFVTPEFAHYGLFAPYWRESISSFERSTRKPFDDDLRQRDVSGTDKVDWCRPASRFCVGEWLVELLCLIPIQICVARENRFIPLRDGVFSPDLEQSLLGADLAQVVDSLSFGWYESLLGSYYIGRKVKVVSSMGQQSVGKSYMINHFTDCSFQGSAMRTTEGCWMSLTPTDDYLVVSLDFEGLDSIERSAQEDTLLVLFNAAISNLVLFRNNFALSRDLAGSFQSFQSSSLVLDPAANPTLFQGRLSIIVKDVIDSDSKEIVKEFSEKLHHIVTQEQDSNFITRLHNGSIGIIPWPVIESKKFYTMFEQLRKVLYKQPVTHPGAGVFLSTLKTLMAKLKTNDWGALDQNLAALRAQRLEAMLSVAFEYGLADADTKIPLKDIDSDTVIPGDYDSAAVFYIQSHTGGPIEASQRLAHLRDLFISTCHRQDAQWSLALTSYLDALGDARIKHVENWLDANAMRFATHADIMALRRKSRDVAVALKAALQLCNLECYKCRLTCVEPRHHLGQHTCQTDHICTFACEYCTSQCDLPAGHDSTHICSEGTHLCGKQCDLSDKRGCLGACTKVRPLITSMKSTFAQLENINVERSAHSKEYVYLADMTIRVPEGVVCPATSIMSNIHAKTSLAPFLVNYARGYAANDSGAPMLCNMVCVSIGRHVHIDHCRAQGTVCEGPQLQHIHARMLPQADIPKDYISHELYWSRSGFKDPYTREEQTDFSKCDHLCRGPEHEATQNAQAQPSYCTLPMFHLPQPLSQSPSEQGYVSRNGHAFACKNPSVGHQAFHVIFVIDRSGSMGYQDRAPQMGSEGTPRIIQRGLNNRLGAVYSAVYSFWTARNAALESLVGQGGTPLRRDSYSVILFDGGTTVALENDFTNSPNQLLELVLTYGVGGSTDFNGALRQAQLVMENNWSPERSPVVIFLSDGECRVSDNKVYDLAQRSQALGRSLRFHAVSFGPQASSYYLRRMKDITTEVYARAPRDPLAPPGDRSCSYTEAIDTIMLAETFLGLAESLQKPRASLLRGRD